MRFAAITASLVTLLGTFWVAAYAMDGTNVLTSDTVAVVDHVVSLPPRNAFVLSIGSADNPADYEGTDAVDYTGLEWPLVADTIGLQSLHPTRRLLSNLTDRFKRSAATLGATDTSPLYMIWSHSSLLYGEAYGLQSPPQMYTWLHLMETSRRWTLVYRAGDVYLFRLRTSAT